MSKKSVKALMITSCAFGLAGIACFVVKLIEATMRTAHDWAKTFVILGFVFLGIALVILCTAVVVETIKEKKSENKGSESEEELLAKYKSKNK